MEINLERKGLVSSKLVTRCKTGVGNEMLGQLSSR